MECLLFSNVTFLRLLLVGSTRTIPLLTHGTRSHEIGRLVSDQPAGAVNDKRAGGGYAADPPFRLSPWKHSLLGPGPSQPAFLLAARRPAPGGVSTSASRRSAQDRVSRHLYQSRRRLHSHEASRLRVWLPMPARPFGANCCRRPGPATVLARGCKSAGPAGLRWRPTPQVEIRLRWIRGT